MKNHFVVLITLSVLAITAVGSATPGGTDSDVAGVQAWMDAMVAAQTAGDVDASMDLLTDDTVGMPPDGTIIGDADAWLAYWENLYSGDSLEPALSNAEYQAVPTRSLS